MSEVEVTQADIDRAHEWMRGQTTGLRMMLVKPRGIYEILAAHRIAAEEGKAELVEAAEALRDDMLERARIAALLRKDAAVIVEAGNGVWLRFNEALARVRGEG